MITSKECSSARARSYGGTSEEIDYRSLGHHGSPEALRLGFHLVLYALARHKYFLGGERAPILQPGLRGKDSSALSFTVAEARDVVEKTLGEILQGAQLGTFVQWFAELDLERAFRLLTLTLALEPDPRGARPLRVSVAHPAVRACP